LSNIRGRVGQAKKRLDSALALAKRTGQIWEWRVNNILDDLRILIANLEREENKLRD
jgi:hypothetical protein